MRGWTLGAVLENDERRELVTGARSQADATQLTQLDPLDDLAALVRDCTHTRSSLCTQRTHRPGVCEHGPPLMLFSPSLS
jgi:hypothetical protein